MRTTHIFMLICVVLVACLSPACGRSAAEHNSQNEDWPWELPVGFPTPKVPADNPMNVAKFELGRRLFYDKRMSGNQTFSCASCHKQELAFTDGKARGEGSTGELHPRSPMGLTNVAYNATFNWVNPLVTSLEAQALAPLFGDQPVELGMTDREDELIARLGKDPVYVDLFKEAFIKEHDPGLINVDRITKALATFERALISGDSPYDKWTRGDDDAMSASAKRGKDLFFSERLECFHCHGNFNFSDAVTHNNTSIKEVVFHNNGLYNLSPQGAYPKDNQGLFEFTGVLQDMGRFRAPTLRNIEVTAPYMHDGSITTLNEVVDHYARGGRLTQDGPLTGDGSKNPQRSEFVQGFIISPKEKQDLIAFLKALTDDSFLQNSRFSDPFAP